MTDRKAMEQALEALGWTDEWRPDGLKEQAITALRERLAQPEQSAWNPNDHYNDGFRDGFIAAHPEQGPVAWEDVLGAIARGWTHDDNKHKPMDVQLAVAIAKEIQDMVSAPPQRKPLTDERCDNLWAAQLFDITDRFSARAFIRDVEAAHGIKGEA